MRDLSLKWLFLLGAAVIQPALAGYDPNNPVEELPWKEVEVDPPAFPKQENLKAFYISAIATNKYFVDVSTLMPGADGAVRYVLVVVTSGGATNVSFEGMNCKDGTWKHYASGRSDGTWVKSRAARNDWRPIENKPIHPHHAVLQRNFFCPSNHPILTADEGRNAFRLGMHPDAPR